MTTIPKCAYVLYDTVDGTIEIRHFGLRHRRRAEKILAAGLPERPPSAWRTDADPRFLILIFFLILIRPRSGGA